MAYNPLVPPQTNDDLLPYLNEEFVRVAQALNDNLEGLYEIRHQMPVRLKPGLVVYFDGVNANPLGTGAEGLYRYGTTGWVYIG